MSKARLVITAVVEQHRAVAEVASSYGVHRSWVYKLVARYQCEGEVAFGPRSRRPRSSPRAVTGEAVAAVLVERDRLVASGHDAGPETIRWHLQRAGVVVSRASIARILTRHGKVVPAPRKKPKSAYIRFEAEQPNECWQSDFTHVRLADGTDVEVITWLDDHSRMVLHLSAHSRVTGPVVLKTFRAAVAEHGCPAATLTDNAMVYTVRLSASRLRGGRNTFEAELAALGVTQKNSRPNHPTTCGKVERFQQTLKAWLTRQGGQAATLAELHTLLDRFRHEYNTQRPHRSLHRRTPAAAYTARPKAGPGEPPDRTHARIRRDKVNNGKITLRHAGTLYSIGVGRAHNGTPVLALIHGQDITISDATTGNTLRRLTLDTSRKYQPQNTRQGEP